MRDQPVWPVVLDDRTKNFADTVEKKLINPTGRLNPTEEVPMSRPSFLMLGLITCHATEDLTGSDDLVGVLGLDRFSIGQFSAGSSRDVAIERPVERGITELTIIEKDTLVDDPLITVDLTQDMDIERVVGILTGGARYNVSFVVRSAPD